jgi:hypothetical protein
MSLYLLQRTNVVLLKYGDHNVGNLVGVSINYSSFEFKTLGVQIVVFLSLAGLTLVR